jgi:hypothetical protein
MLAIIVAFFIATKKKKNATKAAAVTFFVATEPKREGRELTFKHPLSPISFRSRFKRVGALVAAGSLQLLL